MATTVGRTDPASLTLRSAAVTSVALDIGFGGGAIVTLGHFARHGELPMTPWGFRAMAGGPFERLGSEQFVALLWALVAVCAVDALAGIWLWRGERRGARLAVATTPAALTLGVGFALPFLLAGIPLRTVLLLAGRRSLR
jgi:hypothetical protein